MIQDTIHRAATKVQRTILGKPFVNRIARYATDTLPDVDNASEVARLFASHKGRTIHKWLHYLDLYDRHFASFRGTDVKMLEIGVYLGGSLELWRKHLGYDATIFGVDINPDCAGYVDPPNQVRIGSQADASFLQRVVSEMGGVDIVLDDGSHIGRHQRASFNALYPLLSEGGLYIIEDMHTAYIPGVDEGGYRRPGTAAEMVKSLIDDMHHWYHSRGGRVDLGAIHVYDSMAVIEKKSPVEPTHIKVPLRQGSV